MPNIICRLALKEYRSDIKEMGSCLLLAFDKLTVQQAGELRNRLRAEGIRLRVVRNRLIRMAMEEEGYTLPRFTGKCGIAYGEEEKAITAARLLRDFARENRRISLEVLAGIIENEVITGEKAKGIADMPDRKAIRAMLLSAMIAPARGLLTALNALPGGLSRCLDQRGGGED